MLLYLYNDNYDYINAFAVPTAESTSLTTRSFDVSNCTSDYIYVDIVDYAMNRSTTKIDLTKYTPIKTNSTDTNSLKSSRTHSSSNTAPNTPYEKQINSSIFLHLKDGTSDILNEIIS
ncbi:hypothetical protein [Cellulosilyticum ruminicola]|uniref:hypothetical protein n=1 Tax=Cellulosilyticum ruminicola TaxID=425254 RepID=UPI0006D0A406|nr:hypothetical protein [Cellulosilyticum ruminicola]